MIAEDSCRVLPFALHSQCLVNISTFYPPALPPLAVPDSLQLNTTVPKIIGKDRFNYASFDCGAVIRAQNKESQYATSILQSSKDAYMLNPCLAEKFVEIELCQDILVDQLILANFEFFSSQVKNFKVLGSAKIPPKWVVLGSFTSQNSRVKQQFHIKDPNLWVLEVRIANNKTKFLRIEFQTHYGTEFYCPLTLVQVFGTTMMEEIKGLEDELPTIIPDIEPKVIIEKITETKSESHPVKQSLFTKPITSEFCLPDEVNATPIPVKSESSIFTKMHARISQLERTSVSIEQNSQIFTNKQIQLLVKREEIFMESFEKKMMLIEKGFQANLIELEEKRAIVDRHLASAEELMEEMKVNLAWSQFWNYLMLFFGAISIKLLSDHLGGIWSFWTFSSKPAVENDTFEEYDELWEDSVVQEPHSSKRSRKRNRRKHGSKN